MNVKVSFGLGTFHACSGGDVGKHSDRVDSGPLGLATVGLDESRYRILLVLDGRLVQIRSAIFIEFEIREAAGHICVAEIVVQ